MSKLVVSVPTDLVCKDEDGCVGVRGGCILYVYQCKYELRTLKMRCMADTVRHRQMNIYFCSKYKTACSQRCSQFKCDRIVYCG